MCMVMGCPNGFRKLNPRATVSELAGIGIMLKRTVVVPRRRLELPRPNGHWHLKPARLPIPPPGHAMRSAQNGRLDHTVRIATNAGVSNLFRVSFSTELCWMCGAKLGNVFSFFYKFIYKLRQIFFAGIVKRLGMT